MSNRAVALRHTDQRTFRESAYSTMRTFPTTSELNKKILIFVSELHFQTKLTKIKKGKSNEIEKYGTDNNTSLESKLKGTCAKPVPSINSEKSLLSSIGHKFFSSSKIKSLKEKFPIMELIIK